MKKLRSVFNFEQLRKSLTLILLAGLLVVTTACSTPSATTSSRDASLADKDGVPTTQYGGKPKNEPFGGMNHYSDVDPRVDTTKAEAKKERLVKQAEQRIEQNDGLSVDETLDKAQDEFKDVTRSAKSLKKNIDSTADDVSQQIQDSTAEVRKSVRRTVNDIASDVQKR